MALFLVIIICQVQDLSKRILYRIPCFVELRGQDDAEGQRLHDGWILLLAGTVLRRFCCTGR